MGADLADLAEPTGGAGEDRRTQTFLDCSFVSATRRTPALAKPKLARAQTEWWGLTAVTCPSACTSPVPTLMRAKWRKPRWRAYVWHRNVVAPLAARKSCSQIKPSTARNFASTCVDGASSRRSGLFDAVGDASQNVGAQSKQGQVLGSTGSSNAALPGWITASAWSYAMNERWSILKPCACLPSSYGVSI
jgi:hypothetical protein